MEVFDYVSHVKNFRISKTSSVVTHVVMTLLVPGAGPDEFGHVANRIINNNTFTPPAPYRVSGEYVIFPDFPAKHRVVVYEDGETIPAAPDDVWQFEITREEWDGIGVTGVWKQWARGGMMGGDGSHGVWTTQLLAFPLKLMQEQEQTEILELYAATME